MHFGEEMHLSKCKYIKKIFWKHANYIYKHFDNSIQHQFNSFSDQAIHMLKGKAAQNYEAAFK